jgi:hypothetical protein
LGDFDRPFANHVTAQYLRGPPISNELAKARLALIDNRADGRVEMDANSSAPQRVIMSTPAFAAQ